MLESNDKFKWLWISWKILYDENLNLIETCIFSAINSLDKSDEHCRASNNYLAKAFKCSRSTVKRAIAHLKELGYIEEVEWGKVGICRKLKNLINIDSYPAQSEPGSKWTGFRVSQGVVQIEPGGGSNWAGYPAHSEPQYIYIDNIIDNNIYNNIGAQKNFCSPNALRASTDTANAETGLSDDDEVKKEEKPKTKRKSQKQQRYEQVMSSAEFTSILFRDVESESDKKELLSLWGEYVELRCSKDYKAFTDWAIKRNLNVLDWTSIEERKEIISKSVTKWRTGLFPLNDYDKQRLATKEANVEWSDERLYNKIFKLNCQEKEDIVPEGTLHKFLMELCEKYWTEKIKDIYYNRVRPEIKSIYGIKRDWVKH